jgi:hypothetical protein
MHTRWLVAFSTSGQEALGKLAAVQFDVMVASSELPSRVILLC